MFIFFLFLLNILMTKERSIIDKKQIIICYICLFFMYLKYISETSHEFKIQIFCLIFHIFR